MSTVDITYRPIANDWSGELTPTHKRMSKSTFKADFTDTRKLLVYEVGRLGRKDSGAQMRQQVVVQLAITEMDLRLDGQPKVSADYLHPGVIVSFDSVHGPLRYQTDAFDDWRANLRAFALGLEALRKVDRYGIAKRGEQYTGWRAIEAAGSSTNSANSARKLINSYGGLRAAMKATHPDQGGDPKAFRAVMEAKRVLGV